VAGVTTLPAFLERASRALPDQVVRELLFLWRQHARCNLGKPRSFSEKVTWRILYDRRPLLAWTCDKLLAKEYVNGLQLDVVVPDVLWTGIDVRELARESVSGRWVLKPNHASGRYVIFGEGSILDTKPLEARLTGALDDAQGEVLREWAYTQAKRLLLLERRIEGESQDAPPLDYKVFVFHGEAHLIQVDVGRFVSKHTRALYSPDWERKPWTLKFPPNQDVPRPENLENLVQVAETIAAPFDFIRVDLYTDGHTIYFGELTPYPGGGVERFQPRRADFELGDLWELPAGIAISSDRSIRLRF
jgi:hypothetical protein